MKPFTLPFSESSLDLETAGGKGLSLAAMSRANLPVPDGFILTTEAYRVFVADNSLQGRILSAVASVDPSDTAALEAAAGKIAALFAVAAIPAEIDRAVREVVSPLQARPLAVRSSATAEDLPEASFAGQQETYLNVRGLDSLLVAVKKCWASLWTARAISYRIRNNVDQESVALAVVVQELVFAEAAGVMFTANPVNGRRGEMLINAAWGLGEAVVSGAVSPDTLIVEKTKMKILSRQTAEKEVMTVRTDTGTEERPVPARARKKAVLSNRQAVELAGLGLQIENFYGSPMDIEWALAGGRFFILQARPITALPAEWTLPDPKAVYARGSLAEHIPGPVAPLFASLGLRVANEETNVMWEQMMGKNYLSMMVGGRFYLPLNGYVYGGFKMTSATIWPTIKMTVKQTGPMFRNSVNRAKLARDEFFKIVDSYENLEPRGMRPAALLDSAEKIFRAACLYFTKIQACLPAASSSEMLFGRLYRSLVKRGGDPDEFIFLLGGESQALRAEKSLFALASWAGSRDPFLRAHLLNTPADDLLAEIEAGKPAADIPPAVWQEFVSRFHDHTREFDRTSYDFDFTNPTPLELPAPQIEALKSFLSGELADPAKRQSEALARREDAAWKIAARLVWPVKGWFTGLLRWAQETGPMREDVIAWLGAGHPAVRRFLLELGRRFTENGALQQDKDIFWLSEGEVLSLIADMEIGRALPDFQMRIMERKAELEEWKKLTPPVLLPERSRVRLMIHGGEARKVDGRLTLVGVGTSGGLVTAPARVILNPEDFGRMQPGDVLVAVTTTPAWTPLFTLASAVVTDIGGPLSHSSIVAREFGIPAVMAARTATRQILDGQMVTVDGSKGTVTLLE